MPPNSENEKSGQNTDETSGTILKQIRTFQGDVAEALRRQKESLVSIQRTEAMRRSATPKDAQITVEESKRRRDTAFLVLGSIVLIVLSLGGAWTVYYLFKNKTTTPITEKLQSRFIATNTDKEINLADSLTRESLITALDGATLDTPARELRHVNLVKSVATGITEIIKIEEFLATLKTRAPGSLVRAIEPVFMFGSLGQTAPEDDASNFIILKLVSYENAFAGVLEWETTMAQDIGPIFAPQTLLKEVDSDSKFRDVIDRNKDLRELTVKGQTVILYSFFDNNILIITDDIETLRFLINRLTLEKLSR